MEQLNQYKLERYRTAFQDYETVTRKFHEEVLALEFLDKNLATAFDTLIRDLNIKHAYFTECARRLLKTV